MADGSHPQDQLRGYSAPLDPRGAAMLYGPPPWHFHGRMLTLFLRCDAQAIAALVPAPLRPHALPIVRVSTYEMTCDNGLGPEFAARRPELAQFRETGVSLYVEHDGVAGNYCAFIWCDGEAEIAVGRELYGWPQLLGQMWLTRPPHARTWQPDDEVAALCSRAGRPAWEARMTVERAGDVPLGLPAFLDFYTMTVLPSPERPELRRTITRTRMQDIRADDMWSGPAVFTAHAPELAWLNGARVVGARTNLIAWTKPYGRIVHQETVAAK